MGTKIPSEFVPLDVNYAHDRAIRAAGPMAELLFVRGLAYARKHKTGGLIPDYDLPVAGIGVPSLTKNAAALVRERLWSTTKGGWVIRSWEKWNPVSEQERHDKQSQGGALGAHNRWHIGADGKPSDDCTFCTPMGTHSVPNEPPTWLSMAEREGEREKRESHAHQGQIVTYVTGPGSATFGLGGES